MCGGKISNYLSVSFDNVAPYFLVFYIPYPNNYYAYYYSKQGINIKIGNKEAIVYESK